MNRCCYQSLPIGEMFIPNCSFDKGVVLVPPATAKRNSLNDWAQAICEQGLAVLSFEAPYIRTNSELEPRGLQNPDNEYKMWALNASRLAYALQEFSTHSGVKRSQIGLVGKNLGGAMAAYFLANETAQVGAIAITGSIPHAIDFWVNSHHPVAAAARKQGPHDAARYQEKLRCTDLLQTLPQIKIPTLIQIGRNDDWLDEASISKVEEVAQDHQVVRSYDDDHSMSKPHTQQDVVAFLAKQLCL